MLAALCCVATMIIKIPSPLKGYLNLGDCIVLLSGFMLSPLYGFLAAGIGSALADVFSGYVVYAPATFLIKGLMALAAFGIYKALNKKINSLYCLSYFYTKKILGNFLSSHTLLSALSGLTSVFGMGTGVPHSLSLPRKELFIRNNSLKTKILCSSN